MAIVVHDEWKLSQKGKNDAARHQKKVDKAIRENVKDVISEESIITQKRGKKIRIPIKGMKDYKFIYGKSKGGGAGVGQGKGKPGDVIGKSPKDGQGQGGAGNTPGEDWMETEVDLDYLIEVMFQDLGLPWLEDKEKALSVVPKGWKFETITKKGIMPRIHKKRTMIEALKRTVAFVGEIINETGCTESEGNRALSQAHGDINEAIDIIKDGKLNGGEEQVYIEDDDMRFKQIEQDIEYHSNAVVIAMMDTSGSMTTDKKYLARSMLFWMTEFLKKVYDHVEIRFIQHTTDAHIVDEDTFFHKGESGGTACHTAFDKANYLIDTEYPINEWNVYCMYVSDGEDWDTSKTMTSIKEMLKRKINMLGYAQINPGGQSWGDQLLTAMLNTWKFKKKEELGTIFYRNDDERFLISKITEKEHVYPALRHFLFMPKGKG